MADGCYTVMLPGGVHRTIRVEPASPDFCGGDKILTFLYGRDNTGDYRPFAHVTPAGTIRIWKRFHNDGVLAKAVALLAADALNAAQTYGLRSGRCFRCRRLLTHPDSIRRGMGPACAERLVTQLVTGGTTSDQRE